jgi:hypothetical protein
VPDDRPYEFPKIRAKIIGMGLDNLNVRKRKPRGILGRKQSMRLGLWRDAQVAIRHTFATAGSEFDVHASILVSKL